MDKISSIDLFAGVGGMRIALNKALNKLGLKDDCRLYSEINLYCQQTYDANFPNTPLLKDIKSIHPNLIGFLKIEGIETIWSKIQNNAPSELHFKEQFHRWFDGLKTIRFLKRFSS